MKEFLDNIKKKDPAARSYLQIILFYPGVHALFLHRIAHFFYNLKIPVIPYLIAYFSRVFTSIEIHPADMPEPAQPASVDVVVDEVET